MNMEMQPMEQDFGLNIVKNIVEMHKGNVKIDSEVNKGTEVTIRIPVKKEVKSNE